MSSRLSREASSPAQKMKMEYNGRKNPFLNELAVVAQG